MARIPEQEIERLKREISVVRLAEVRGVSLSKSGDNLLGLCPFHDDREPSLVITPEKNLWHCLGACQAGGSVIDWVMRAEGISFRHAVELLRKDAVPAVSKAGPPPKLSHKRSLGTIARADAEGVEVLERVVAHYEATLRESAEAQAYLAHRGLSHGEVVEHFRLGFSNRTLGYKLPHGRLKDGAALRTKLMEVGVYRSSGHEHFTGCLVIPLFDAGGQVVGLYGRRIEKPNPGMPKHLYLPGPHRGVFNRQGLGGEEVIVCEALIDALTFWCAGLRNVTSAYGVEGVTDELVETLVSAGTKRVMIAFDRDEAGDVGAEKLSERLAELGIESFRVLFPRNMDANAYARKVSPSDKALELAVRQAMWMRAGKKSKTSQAVPLPEETTLSQGSAETTSEEMPPFVASREPEESRSERGSAGTRSEEIPSLVASAALLETSIQTPPLPSTPPIAAPPLESQGEERLIGFGDRKWRARPAGKSGAGELRVNVIVSREGERTAFFVDTLDLYAARHRAAFAKQAAAELELDERVVTRELGQLMLALEAERAAAEKAAEAPKAQGPTMTEAERGEALALLRNPHLCDRILEDLERAGIVGEETNKLVAYLAATSRKLEEPLAVVIQSSSAAGKSSLMDAVLALIPEEDRVQYSAMTGQSLFYMSGENLKHKVLAIVEEEGAERASYALKLLQSEGELTIASTGKDPATGRLVTQTYRVEGPVMIFLTTTAIDVDEELLNRCLVLTVDEGREQTKAIHERQRRSQTLEGLLAREERDHIRRVHRNAQRLLRPIRVVNPFALELGFADHATRTRRDHMKYLTLIRAVALLHQHQRPLKTVEHRGQQVEYIEVTREDIAIANHLAHHVLGRSLDELPPQTRRLLELVHGYVAARSSAEAISPSQFRFSRRDVREHVGWSVEQLRVHLARLVDLEYLVVHRGRRGQSFEYELAYGGEGKEGERFVLGLGPGLEPSPTISTWGGERGWLPGRYRGQTGPKPAGAGSLLGNESSGKTAANGASSPIASKIASQERTKSKAS
jgi:DNA primase catalytic core